MKKTKTFRDLQKKNFSPVKIGEEKTEPKIPSLQLPIAQNVLDLSLTDKQKTIVESQNKKIMDIAASSPKKEKFRFVQVENHKSKKQERLNEIIRLVAAGTLILFLINIVNIYQRGLTIKNDLIATASSGYENLIQAGNESKGAQFSAAANSFTASAKNFDDALNTLKFLETNQNVFFTKEKTVESAQNLLQAGKNISEAGVDFARGIEHLQDLPALFLQNNGALALNPVKAKSADENSITPKVPLTTLLEQDLAFLEQASDKINAASQNLNQVSDDVLPQPMQAKLTSARTAVAKLQNILQETQDKIPVIMKMLGQRYLHRYLILLQNDAEARPTGGFIGSYLIVDVNDGYVINTEFHDVYQTDGQLQENIPAPEDIAKITNNWRMRDSNYSPDFAVSAEKAAWFLQKEKGPSVDSVIALNQSFIAKLFDVTGPVQLDGLKAPLTKDNYQTIISYLVESKTAGESDPKKILRSFIPAFQKQLLASKNIGQIIKFIIQGLNDRDILLYSRDEDIENLFDELGFSGRVIRTKPSEDFLQVITTSVGGNKSDLYIQQAIQHTTIITKDGTVNDEVTITRKHTWTSDELTHWKTILKEFGYTELSQTVQYILGSGPNKSYIKVYVPQGAVLTASDGINQTQIETHTDETVQKNYFMFELDVPAGEEKTVTLSYQLPLKLNLSASDTYRFFAQRQPGIVLSTLQKNLVVAQGLKIYQSYPNDLNSQEDNQLIQKTQLQNDDYMAALVGVE